MQKDLAFAGFFWYKDFYDGDFVMKKFLICVLIALVSVSCFGKTDQVNQQDNIGVIKDGSPKTNIRLNVVGKDGNTSSVNLCEHESVIARGTFVYDTALRDRPGANGKIKYNFKMISGGSIVCVIEFNNDYARVVTMDLYDLQSFADGEIEKPIAHNGWVHSSRINAR